MSEIKVNKITPRTACGTTQLGDSGDTFTVPAGATISNLGTATGFGGTGVVSWDTASIKTTGFTAVTGTGYFCNTTGGGFTVTLPASPTAGDVVGVSDYAKTFDTDTLTLGRNSENIGGVATNATLETEGVAVTLVYVDSTKGWIVTDSGLQSDANTATFITATGGCITTCGNYKMHTFFGPGTFCVSALGNSGGGGDGVSYMIVAGGAGGGGEDGGGGGAGGYREGKQPSDPYTGSPLAGSPATVTVQGYPIVIGAGGAGQTSSPTTANPGDPSSGLGLTSTGGGRGGGEPSAAQHAGVPGGSGGGGYGCGGGTPYSGGNGNDPPVSPAQGTGGGTGHGRCSPIDEAGGGGGGATVAGSAGASNCGGNGGTGGGTEINTTTMPAPSPTPSAQIGTPGPSAPLRYFAGGGGGGVAKAPATAGTGGTGGGGAGADCGAGTAGTINTGSGGGGGGGNNGAPTSSGAAGGSGIVVIRYKYQ
jgi:hypothetical protein